MTGRQKKTSKPHNIFDFIPLNSKEFFCFFIHFYGPCLISEQLYNLLLELKEDEKTELSAQTEEPGGSASATGRAG